MQHENFAHLLDQIIIRLFEADYRRINENILNIHKQNQEAHRMDLDVFSYMGEIYNPEHRLLLPSSKRQNLHSSLVQAMDNLLLSKKIIDEDKQFIRQALFPLLKSAQTLQQLRDSMPDCLQYMIEEIKGLSRSRTIEEILGDNPRATKQYKKMESRIQVYSVARMIF